MRGTRIGPAELDEIRRLIRRHPEALRQELARRVCRRFRWRRPNGSWAIPAAAVLLRRLAARGWIELPPPQRGLPKVRSAERTVPPHILAATAPPPGWVPAAGAALTVRPITASERETWRAALTQYHPLGAPPPGGEAIAYGAWLGGQPVAWLLWGSASRQNGPRDRYLAWPPAQRERRLSAVVDNRRFLIVPSVRIPHLASRILGANLRRLARDWQQRYGHRVVLAETFVDRTRYAGTCYRAANWIEVGETAGWGKQGATYRWHGRPKAVFLYPLDRRAFAWLVAAESPLDPDPPKGERPMAIHWDRIPLTAEDGLFALLRQIHDPRKARGLRHRLPGMLAMVVGATLAGMQGPSAIAQWAAELPVELRVKLGGARKAPAESTFRRVLGLLDPATFEAKIGAWARRHGLLPGEPIAVDGKTLRGSHDGETPALKLLSAMGHESGTVVAQTEVPATTNEIPVLKEVLQDVEVTGRVVTADAMHTQTDTASWLVEEKHADYVLMVKDNQPTLREDLEAVDWSFSPSGPDARQGPRTD